MATEPKKLPVEEVFAQCVNAYEEVLKSYRLGKGEDTKRNFENFMRLFNELEARKDEATPKDMEIILNFREVHKDLSTLALKILVEPNEVVKELSKLSKVEVVPKKYTKLSEHFGEKFRELHEIEVHREVENKLFTQQSIPSKKQIAQPQRKLTGYFGEVDPPKPAAATTPKPYDKPLPPKPARPKPADTREGVTYEEPEPMTPQRKASIPKQATTSNPAPEASIISRRMMEGKKSINALVDDLIALKKSYAMVEKGLG